MIKPPYIISVVLVGLVFLTAGGARAASSAVEGIVKDASGQPLREAQIRIEGVEGSAYAKVAKTDANGRYKYSGLGDGTYSVSLIVNGAVKASIANVGMETGTTTTLNFELRKSGAQPSARGKHYVWVPSSTGSNVAGRWIEVDDTNRSKRASVGAVERMNSSAGQTVRRMQDNAGVVTGH